MRRALEHHVFEKMAHPRFPRRFIDRSDAIPNLECGERYLVVFDKKYLESVVESELLDRGGRDKGPTEDKNYKNGEDPHCSHSPYSSRHTSMAISGHTCAHMAQPVHSSAWAKIATKYPLLLNCSSRTIEPVGHAAMQ